MRDERLSDLGLLTMERKFNIDFEKVCRCIRQNAQK